MTVPLYCPIINQVFSPIVLRPDPSPPKPFFCAKFSGYIKKYPVSLKARGVVRSGKPGNYE